MPLVTVILPVHNGNYLQESIQSVLAQEYRDFVLHILDDDSSDESAAIAQDTGDPRVRYSRNPQRFGLFKTLNRGCAEARTPWVRIWAHDDRMLPHCLGAFVDFIGRHPEAGMVYSDFYEMDPVGQRTGGETVYQSSRERTPAVTPPAVSALLFFVYGCLPGNISTVLLRREAWEKVGGFTEGLQQAPDYEMWVRLSALYDVGFIRDKLIELRSHPLQLGRVGQKLMTTVEEEFPVFQLLLASLEGKVSLPDLRHYWRQHRGRQHMHWVTRALVRGDFAAAARGWRTIRRYGQPWYQAWWWLRTLNGRYFHTDSNQFFDSQLPGCYRDRFAWATLNDRSTDAGFVVALVTRNPTNALLKGHRVRRFPAAPSFGLRDDHHTLWTSCRGAAHGPVLFDTGPPASASLRPASLPEQ